MRHRLALAVTAASSIWAAGLAHAAPAVTTETWDRISALKLGERADWTIATPETGAVRFELEPMSVLGPDARILVGDTPIAAPDVTLLIGRAPLRPGATVFLALRPDGRAVGHLEVPGTGPLVVRGERGSEGAEGRDRAGSWWATPAPARSGPDPDIFCGTEDGLPVAPNAAAAGAPIDPPAGDGLAIHNRLVRVAVECDMAYVGLFGGDVEEATTYAITLTAGVSAIKQRDLGLSLRLDFLRLWPGDDMPFGATNLGQFRGWWQDNMDFESYELVHLYSGRRDTGYGGVAYLQDACTHGAYGISAFLNGFGPESPPQPSLDTWDLVVVAHEMGHNLSSPHTWNYDPAIDACFDGVNERGTIMSYCHTRMGGLLNSDVRFHALVQDRIVLNNPVAEFCLPWDCNDNLIPDDEEIASGAEVDLNLDGIPDSCQDCDGNGILDDVDIANGAADADENGRPDVCDVDCDGDGLPDAAQIAAVPELDLDGDRILDACESDCDENGVADHVDIDLGNAEDIDRNRIPDHCEDCDGNGVRDWIDAGRGGFEYVADAAFGVREYHGGSGVFTRDTGDPNGIVTGVTVGALAFANDGRLFAAVVDTGRIAVLDADGTAWSVLADVGSAVRDLALDTDGSILALVDGAGVRRFDAGDGTDLGVVVAPDPTRAELRAIDLDESGRLLLVDAASGVWTATTVGGPVTGPVALPKTFVPRDVLGRTNGDVILTGAPVAEQPDVIRLPGGAAPAVAWGGAYPLDDPWGLARGPGDGTIHLPTSRSSGWRMVQFDAASERYERAFVRGDDAMTRPTAIAFRPASPPDVDGNLIPDDCECRADVDGDGTVGMPDLLIVLGQWGEPVEPGAGADVDADGAIGLGDLIEVLADWGPC